MKHFQPQFNVLDKLWILAEIFSFEFLIPRSSCLYCTYIFILCMEVGTYRFGRDGLDHLMQRLYTNSTVIQTHMWQLWSFQISWVGLVTGASLTDIKECIFAHILWSLNRYMNIVFRNQMTTFLSCISNINSALGFLKLRYQLLRLAIMSWKSRLLYQTYY